MATTICLGTLITKSLQWVIIRLGDYPIHTEKSNRLDPITGRHTHPCSTTHICTSFVIIDGMCMCVYVYNRQSERDSTSVCNRKRQGKLKGWLILVKYFQLQGCPLQKGSCTAFSGRSKCGRIPLLMYMFVQLSGVHGRCHNTYNVALREPWGISPSSSQWLFLRYSSTYCLKVSTLAKLRVGDVLLMLIKYGDIWYTISMCGRGTRDKNVSSPT